MSQLVHTSSIMSNTTRYLEIAEALRERVERRIYGEGERLPGERALTAEFGVQRSTLRRALEILVDQGLIERDAQRGTFVSGRPRPIKGSLALCIGRPGDSDAPGMIARGAIEVLNEYGSELNLDWMDRSLRTGQIESATPTVEEVQRKNIAGVLIYPQRHRESDRIRELAQKVPVVLLDARLPGLDVDFVGFDDYQAGRTAARCLYEAGHRRIAFFGSIEIEPSSDRLAGVADFLAEHDLKPLWRFAQAGGVFSDLPIEALRALFRDRSIEVPTAAVCANDQVAVKAIQRMHQLGMRMPADLALVGFGNTQPEFIDALGLTTLDQPYYAVGREAARMLLDRIQRGVAGPPRNVRLPMSLVTRRSCGTPISL